MSSRHAPFRLGVRSLLFSGIIVGIVLLVSLSLNTRMAEAASSHVDVLAFDGEVNPASLRLLTRAIDTATQDGAQALVIEINSPGGDIDSMNSMTQKELASNIPLITYVSPTGGRAASAASFVTLAAPLAAMAPTTRIGASSPITNTGSDIGSTLKSKIENDLVASITGMQKHYGRNATLAAKMVTNATSYDDATAVKEKIVDLEASSLPALLNAVDGRSIRLSSGRLVTLHTAGTSVQTIDSSALDSFYALLLDPNVIFLLFIVAMIGIYLEISHPGVILPGVAGAISLLLFLFAVGSLSPNWAGLALMVLAFVLLVLDVQLPTHGVLTIGAVISLIVGSLFFFNSGGPYNGPGVNPTIVYIIGGLVGLIGLTLVTFIVRAQRRRINTGVESMIGSRVIALTPLLPEGRVSYYGENWAAILESPSASVDAGSELIVVSVDGLRLYVRPARTWSKIDTHYPQIDEEII